MARIVVFYIAIVSIFADPVWSLDNGTTELASPKKQLLQGSVQHEDASLNGSITQLKGMSAVEDAGPSNGQGVGMLGMYALCASDAASPCYITNVFPTSQLVQCGVQSGDLLLQINGKSPFDYLHTAHSTTPGATISITFQHENTTKTVSVKLSDMRTFIPFLQSYSQWQRSHIPFLKEQREKYRACALI